MAKDAHAAVRDKILDTALSLAEQHSWEAVRLHAVADHAQISLETLRQHFREKEDLVDAWFDRADRAMLETTDSAEFKALDSSRARLEQAMLAWLAALAPHRRVTRQMIYNKLEPGHLHFQIPALLRISRTVQWMREAAGRDQRLPWRAIEETATTAIYLATFLHWLHDDSQNAIRTRHFLERRLRHAKTWADRVYGACGRKHDASSTTTTPPTAPHH